MLRAHDGERERQEVAAAGSGTELEPEDSLLQRVENQRFDRPDLVIAHSDRHPTELAERAGD